MRLHMWTYHPPWSKDLKSAVSLCYYVLVFFLSSGVIHSDEPSTGGSLLHILVWHLSSSLFLHSCVSPDVYERRSMQLEETLPLPARLHRSALPVSTPADAASSGSARQQAARLPRISEARRPQTGGAVRHRADPVDANTLGFHPAFFTSRAPLIWRYLSSIPGWFEWKGKSVLWHVSFLWFLPFLCFQCRLTCVFTTRRTRLWSFNLSTIQTSSLLTRQCPACSPRDTNPRGAASRRPRPNKLWV